MRYVFLFLLISLSLPSFAQVKKAYINKDGQLTNDPQNATSYVLVEKLDGDSAYAAKIYNMHDTVLMQGTYKDELLAIPNGKFIYYDKQTLSKNKKEIVLQTVISHSTDTNSYIRTTGYFINGKKNGLWVDYFSRGVKQSEIMYENGKQNGSYKLYNIGTDKWQEGVMKNDTLEGKVNTYNRDSVLVSEMDVLHGRMTSQTKHLVDAIKNEDFDAYLERKLNKYQDKIIQFSPVIKFTVDKTGKIINPIVIKGISPEFDNLLTSIIVTAPKYAPATYDNIPATQNIIKTLDLYRSNK
jgi:antitoxin component YwqK of YwqJK toxin-antitoxin module